MSTVVALGHFCEVHGPRLVFYTIRNINEPQFVSQCPDLKFCSGCKAPLLEGYISTVQTVQSTAPDPPSPSRPARDADRQHQHDHEDDGSPLVSNSHSAPGGFSSNKGLRPSSSTQHLSSIASTSASGGFVSRGTSTNNCTGIESDTRERGGGCGGGGSGPSSSGRDRDREGAQPSSRSITEPSAGTKYYCSHSNYDHSHLSHLQTCISRTLSCELSPSNSVAFTSSDIWVIGTAFSLKDSQARGFHRRYCLIFTFLPEVPQCCRDPDSLDQEKEHGTTGGSSKHGAPSSGSRGGSAKGHHHPSSKSSKKGGKARMPPIPPPGQHRQQLQHRQGCSSRDDYYSDGDCKGYTGYYGGGYPSLVPYYDYITEEFYNIAKNLQGECDKVYFKEQSISPQRALRLSAFLDGSIPGSSLAAGASSSLGGHGRSSSKTCTKSLPRFSTMLTCSSSASAALSTLIRQHPSIMSSKSLLLLFSLKQCVHKNVTTSQQCFLSATTTSSSLPPVKRKWGYLAPTTPRRLQENYCCSLNLNNHHITFHYINSSIVTSNITTTTTTSLTTQHHHRYHHHQPRRFIHHQSSSSLPPPVDLSSSTNIIIPNSTTNDNNRLLMGGVVKNSKNEDQEWKENEEELVAEEEEMLKDQVWSKGPALLPTFNVGAYANDSENVKKLLQYGVDLSKWEHRYGAIPLLYKSNFETTILPIIKFLMDLGVEAQDLSHILTKNPFIFNEEVGNLKKRVEYLKVKKFEEEAICNIISRNPYWLSFSVPRIDRRLGFYQTYFGLTGDQVRRLASVGSTGPKLITYSLGRVKDVTFTIKEEMGFTSEEIVKLLLTRPRIWKEVPLTLRLRFDYLHNEEKFSHADFMRSPMLFLTRERRMRERIGFLKKLGRAQFDPQQPKYISHESLCTGNDVEWATDVVRVPVAEYNNYLKTL